MCSGPEQVLRGLIRGDERLLQRMMSAPAGGGAGALLEGSLDRRTRMLVRLAALIALGASVDSLHWAVEQASTSGACTDSVVGVLLAAAPAIGGAAVVESAGRMALALGLDPVPAGGKRA
jgi:alkylhydroperoxidase/carboxymuconolactone decarboxylase family protein YurZ